MSHTKPGNRAAATVMLATMLAAVAAGPGAAQDWPQRNVKLVVPLGAGAGADLGARLVAERLQARWGKPIVVENRPGGDGLVGIGAFVSANDDHTLLFSPSGSFTVHPYQHEKLPYDAERDILPIARVSNTLITVSAPAAMGFNSIKDFVERAKAEPGKLNAAAVPGIGDFVLDAFVKATAIKVAKVPYRDIVQAATDLGEGRLQIMMSSLAIVQPQVQAGRVRLLVLTQLKRSELTPGVPTPLEAGYPTLELEGLVGLFGPKSMSQALREKIGADVVAVLADPEIGRRLAGSAQVVNPGGAAQFAADIRRQTAKVAETFTTLGMSRKTK